MDRERQVIVEEINMYDDNPIMLVGDLFEQQIWGNQPLGWSIEPIQTRTNRKCSGIFIRGNISPLRNY